MADPLVVAAQLRGAIERIVESRVNALRPRPAYVKVISVDVVNGKAVVEFSGPDASQIILPIGTLGVENVGQIVRIEGPREDRYIGSPLTPVAPFVNTQSGQGLEAARPSNATMAAAGNRTGWTWYSTDLGVTWRFDGTIWHILSGSISCQVSRTTSYGAAQSINNQSFTLIDGYDVEVDPFGFHATNANALVIPTGFGGVTYVLKASVTYASNPTGTRLIGLYKNGTQIEQTEVTANTTSPELTTIGVATDIVLADGDSITVKVYQASGGSLNLAVGAGTYSKLSLYYVI